MLTKAELIKEAQVPRQTLERWLRDKDNPFEPDAFDEKGKPLFKPERVAQARARHKPKRKKLNESSLEIQGNLFSFKDEEIPDQTTDTEDNIMDVTFENENNMENAETSTESPAQVLAVAEPIVETPPFTDLSAKTTDELVTESQTCLKFYYAHAKASVMYALAAGRCFNELKERCQHGQWLPTLEKIGISDEKARMYRNAAKKYDEDPQFYAEWVEKLSLSNFVCVVSKLSREELPLFVEAQKVAGRPIEDQTAREFEKNVKQWKEPKAEVGGEYLNVLGTDKNKQIVEELNASVDAHEPSQGTFDSSVVSDIPLAENAEIKPSASEEDCPAKEKSSDEWYTPPEYADLVRKVFGGTIELDPASCETANRFIKADKFFDKDTDGLKQDWHKKIFLNPPFSNVGAFVDKFIAEYEAGNIKEAILLTHNKTETDWLVRKLEPRAAVMCFTDHRINFIPESGVARNGTSKRGQIFFYFGEHPEKFMEVFHNIGWMHKHIEFEFVERKNEDDDL